MRIIHYYRDIYRSSGVTTAIKGWQSAALQAGVESIALHAGSDQQWSLPNLHVPHFGRGRQFQIPNLTGHLREGDVLFLHEGWVTSNVAAARQALSGKVPYIVVPHGVYEPSILLDLKRPVSIRRHLERRMLEGAAAVQTFYDSESDYVKNIAPNATTFSIATGIDLPPYQWTGGGNYLAWFGRYSVQHKGIDNMLAAYAAIPSEYRLPLRLRGVDYKGGKSEVMRIVDSLRIGSDVSVGDPILGEEKIRFLCEAEGFLFPSRWESQGIALLEALGAGVPSLVSSSIHLASELEGASASLVVDFSDHASAAQAIRKITGNTAVGANARKYVQAGLAWDCQFDALMQNVQRYAA